MSTGESIERHLDSFSFSEGERQAAEADFAALEKEINEVGEKVKEEMRKRYPMLSQGEIDSTVHFILIGSNIFTSKYQEIHDRYDLGDVSGTGAHQRNDWIGGDMERFQRVEEMEEFARGIANEM